MNTRKRLHLFSIATGVLLLLTMASVQRSAAQRVDDPSGRTAVKLSNQTRYDLMFAIDDDDKGVVPSRTASPEWVVEPGRHLLIAGALVDGRAYWVWTENEAPKGQVCTWTIEEPKQDRGYGNRPLIRTFPT